MTIGDRIRRARKALRGSGGRKVSQAELGAQCGWEDPQSRISHYETNKRVPSIADFGALAAALGVSRAWLMTGEGEPLVHSEGSPENLEAIANEKDRLRVQFESVITALLTVPEPQRETLVSNVVENAVRQASAYHLDAYKRLQPEKRDQ